LANNRGRGAFETLGTGEEMSFDDIAFKSNFAFMDDKTGNVLSRRVDRHFEWGIPLCDAINGMKIPGYPGTIAKITIRL
jgi:2,3-bisphosphoglycerate-independent phosphoglycerate mutase